MYCLSQTSKKQYKFQGSKNLYRSRQVLTTAIESSPRNRTFYEVCNFDGEGPMWIFVRKDMARTRHANHKSRCNYVGPLESSRGELPFSNVDAFSARRLNTALSASSAEQKTWYQDGAAKTHFNICSPPPLREITLYLYLPLIYRMVRRSIKIIGLRLAMLT